MKKIISRKDTVEKVFLEVGNYLREIESHVTIDETTRLLGEWESSLKDDTGIFRVSILNPEGKFPLPSGICNPIQQALKIEYPGPPVEFDATVKGCSYKCETFNVCDAEGNCHSEQICFWWCTKG